MNICNIESVIKGWTVSILRILIFNGNNLIPFLCIRWTSVLVSAPVSRTQTYTHTHTDNLGRFNIRLYVHKIRDLKLDFQLTNCETILHPHRDLPDEPVQIWPMFGLAVIFRIMIMPSIMPHHHCILRTWRENFKQPFTYNSFYNNYSTRYKNFKIQWVMINREELKRHFRQQLWFNEKAGKSYLHDHCWDTSLETLSTCSTRSHVLDKVAGQELEVKPFICKEENTRNPPAAISIPGILDLEMMQPTITCILCSEYSLLFF